MEFPRKYFEDEVRDGFYVDGLMKCAWAAQLEVLESIARVCEKHNIKWFADCGTLLGAVRHGGYIPWDDDLDICMLRDDYTRFGRVAAKELPEGYRVLDYGCEKGYWNLLTRVSNEGRIRIDREHLERFHEFPFVAGVDIFPLDYGAPNEEDEEARRLMIRIVQTVANRDDLEIGEEPTEETLELVRDVEAQCKVKIDYSKPLKKQLYDITVGLFAMYKREEAKEVMLMTYWADFHNHKYALEWFERAVELPFETTTIHAPAAYDAVLRTEYGDYMKLVHAGGVHEYPHYTDQMNQLAELLPQKQWPYDYHFSMDEMELGEQERMEAVKPKQQAKELLQLLGEAHQEIGRFVDEGNIAPAAGLLEQCQDVAIQTGTVIEEAMGEGFVTVRYLEKYCELAYEIHEKLLQGQPLRGSQLCGLLDAAAGEAADSVERDMKQRREIVFLPFKASAWDAMESVWREACEDPDCDVFVIPIPYFAWNLSGNYTAAYYENKLFPEDVQIVDFNAYDFEKRHPDVIVIQNPYDDFNYSTTVHPFFYSSNLRKFTDKLVYIPYFVVDEFDESDERAWKNMDRYVTMPGVVHSDVVIVQSEQMRQNYIKKLTQMAGEQTREIWKKKIRGTGFPKRDKTAKASPVWETLPKEWQAFLQKDDGERKKVILYYTSVSGLLQYKGRMLQKMRSVFETFQNNQSEVVLLWKPDPLIQQTTFGIYKKLWKDYQRLVKAYQEEGFGIYDDRLEPECAVALADAYYGDSCGMVQLCRNAGIPVMLQDVDIL